MKICHQTKTKKESLPCTSPVLRRGSTVLFALLAAAAAALLAGCGGDKSGESVTVGIAKYVAHPALDALEQGVQDELAERGYEDISFDLQNANGDMSTASSIARKFQSQQVDLAVGIATPTAQALANGLTDIPLVYAAVTDPVAAGLVESYDQGGENITGISDMTPVRAQLEMLKRITSLDTLGHIYSSSEANAVVLAEKAKEVCRDMDIAFVEMTVTNSSEVRQAALSIADRVDAFYISNDNTVVSALSSVADVAEKENLPIMSADPTSAEDLPILAAWGFDYYKMGRAAGGIVDQLLQGKDPESIPTQYMTDPSDVDLLLNKDVAAELGLEFPQDALDSAAKIVENGTLKGQK